MSRSLRFWVRVLLAAMLLATLAPAMSRALSATRGVGDWVQICAGNRVSWVQVLDAPDGASPFDSTPALPQVDDCGLCLLAAERFAPLIPSLPVFSGPAPTRRAPQHHGVPLWSVSALAPSARGPPFIR